MDAIRNGRFTSGSISALLSTGKDKVSFGVPALTYIRDVNMERRLQRSLDCDTTAKPLTWGNLVEAKAFEHLPYGYELKSKETIQHPSIDCWAGTPDGYNEDTVFDIKCPFTLKSFCTFADCASIEEIRENHKDGECYYWQIVSNAILTGKNYGELVVYMPYLSEMPDIIRMADDPDHVKAGEEGKHFFILMANGDDLPYLVDGGYYKNIYRFRFEIPQEDKDLLTAKVLKAAEMLVKIPSVVVADYDKETNSILITN
jgi:hypothetical protein